MNHGGKRKGAGRKPLPDFLVKNQCPIRLAQWLIDEIDSMPGSRAETIEKALIKAYKLKEPKKG